VRLLGDITAFPIFTLEIKVKRKKILKFLTTLAKVPKYFDIQSSLKLGAQGIAYLAPLDNPQHLRYHNACRHTKRNCRPRQHLLVLDGLLATQIA